MQLFWVVLLFVKITMAEIEVASEQVSDHDSFREMDKQKTASFFSMFSAADRVDYLLMFLGSVGACVHGASLPVFLIFFGRMIDSLGHLTTSTHDMVSKVSQNALYLVYLGLVCFASAWIGVACWMQTGERQTGRLRLKYLQSVLRKDMNFFDTKARDMNILFHISSDAILVQDAIGDKIGHVIRYFSQSIVGFAMGFASVWQLTLLTLAVAPLMAVAGGAYAITTSTLSEKSETAYAEAGKVAEEVISEIRTVCSFVGEDKAIEAYTKSLQNSYKLGKKSGVAKGVGVGLAHGLLFCSWALLLWYASVLVSHNKTSGGKAFIVIINIIFSGLALGQATPNLAAIAKGQAAVSNIINMIEADSEPSHMSEDGIVLQNVAGKIEFCKVHFAYPSRPNTVFENLSFSTTAGKTFAIVGSSGSGKSTVISMLQRFYEPTSGKILLDGHDLKTLQLKWLREQMGLVSQEPALFCATIADNIIFGKESASMDQILQAAKAANAHTFIQNFPDGYQTQVGEGGTQLSGGQKQRIAIARAVLRNPKVLLLDEATSALDAESELLVQQALDEIMSERTTIVVAHRLSTIRGVDTILVLKDGQVVESGNHLDLLSIGGEYANLVRLQGSKSFTDSSSLALSETVGNSELASISNQQSELNSSSTRQVHPSDEKFSKSSSVSTPSIMELLKLNAPEWPYALLGSVGAILTGAQSPLFALGLSTVLSAFYFPDASEMKHDVQRVALIFVGAGAVAIPAYLLQHYFYTLMGERLTARIRLSIFSAILSNEIGWFDLDENSTGTLTSALAADATLVRSALADRLSTIVQNVSVTVAACVIAFTSNWRMTCVVVATFPLLVVSCITEQLFLKGFGGDYHAYSRATALAREVIVNIRTVAAFGAEDRISMHFASELDKPNKQALLRGHISGFGYGVSQLLCMWSYALVLWYASVLIKHKESDFQRSMKAFIILMVTALAMAETLALTPDIVKGSEALGSVFRILHRKTVINRNDPASKMVTDVKGDIVFRNVKFTYPARPEITVIEDLNMKISAGQSVALVGQSGSGKSTVISLILRFYDPISGTILIDGNNIRTLNLKSLRKTIGLVQQEPALFSTTIYENIKYGNEYASEIEIIEAAKAANAHEFICRMAEGYQTHVGDRGLQLSGGQKQRVAIARAILKNPSILLLDEATSALDTVSEKQVQEALDKLMEGRTTVLVAHRLSTVRDADKIAVLQQGKVVELGSHNQLIARPDSIYRQLVSLQEEKI
ncbi:hypothetical protein K2173_027945 [Erythroxylum novogranatense]|uniref:Uncharacterized protein n=1 Tax=Erythroxylum novogranatense TaxID=1862640 RepID=A0AAV8U0Q3_9ROSI|nr:hypothetical protein K2173_027945 [Erythroxylum novogranatense]